MQRLTTIPGVGAKTASRLVEHFGSEEEALEAIESVDLYSIASSGLGMRPALSIVLGFFSQKLGVSRDDVLRTVDALNLFTEALGVFKAEVVNPRARDRLDLFYPLPSSKSDIILERLQFSAQAVRFVESLSESDLAALDGALASLQPIPRSAKPRIGRTVVVEAQEDYDRLIEMGADRFCRIEKLSDPESIRDHLDSEEHVVLILRRSIYDLDVDAEFVEVFHAPPSLVQLIPETVTNTFSHNTATIEGLAAIASLLDGFREIPAIERIRRRLCGEVLGPLLEAMGELGAEPSSKFGRDVRRLEATLARIQGVLEDTEATVNSSIEEYLSGYETRVSGEKIAQLLKATTAERISSSSLMGLIPREVMDRIQGIIRDAERSLRDALSLDVGEAEWLEGVLPESIALPIEISEKVADRLRLNLSRKLIWLRFKALTEVAAKLAPLVGAFRDSLSAALELDALLAIGKVGSRGGFAIPRLERSEEGIWFRGGTNTRLLTAKGGSDLQCVSYGIGSCHQLSLTASSDERVLLLTGANSGGKTMLLSTIAQITMLAQAGLPAPAAEASVFPVDQIYFFSKPVGIKDAGAFESALTGLVDVASSDSPKLVLVDEFEAATEPGAAAKVLAAVLEILGGRSSTFIVVVTHLAQQLVASMSLPVRVDGIEAKGLDANYNLVVDRSPKFNYIARSTPELIVERLLHRSDGAARETYRKILDKIRGT